MIIQVKTTFHSSYMSKSISCLQSSYSLKIRSKWLLFLQHKLLFKAQITQVTYEQMLYTYKHG